MKINKKYQQKEFFKIFYKIHTLIFLIFILIFIDKIGLNALKNKLTVFDNLGILRYLSIVLLPGQLILIILKREMYKEKSIRDYFFQIIIFIFFMISGGKTASVTYILYFSYSYYVLYKMKKSNIFIKYKKNEKKLMFFAIIGVIVLFSIVYKVKDFKEIFRKVYFRIISTGDIYYMTYSNNIVEHLKKLTLKEYYIYPILSPILRRFGFEVISYIMNSKITFTGSNSRADVILQMNIGYFGIIVSIINAYFMALLRKMRSKNFIIKYEGVNDG